MQNESTPGARGPVFCGVDTHADSHWLCVLDWRGRKVLSRQFPADAAGYEALAGAIAAAGEPACVAMEGTSSWIGNTYLDDFGRDSPASLNSTGDM